MPLSMNWFRSIFGSREEVHHQEEEERLKAAEGLQRDGSSGKFAARTKTSRAKRAMQPIPKDWTEHPAFVGARDVIAMRDLIERTIASAPNATRDEGKALDLALGKLPAWPQYEKARIELSNEDAPIWWSPWFEFPEHDDGIALFQIATLRERAAFYKIKGRSKAEIATRLRAVMSHEEAEALAKEGHADWQERVDKRERRKFCEVLGHTVSAASSSIRNIAWYENAFRGSPHKQRWLSGPCCKKCDMADKSVREIGSPFPHVGVILVPAHPGCAVNSGVVAG
jgi:hypothetical protein